MAEPLDPPIETEVAIVGAGPVGLLLAILLGQQGRAVTLIEKWPDIYDRPRAVTGLPPLKWSFAMFRKTEEDHGQQAPKAGRDCHW